MTLVVVIETPYAFQGIKAKITDVIKLSVVVFILIRFISEIFNLVTTILFQAISQCIYDTLH